ncbi:McrC family protein [Salinicoccus siamensis]
MLIFPNNEEQHIDDDRKVIETTQEKLKSSNLLGFFGNSGDALSIVSRFDDSRNNYFLQYMLSKVYGITPLNFSTGMKSNTGFLDFMVLLFPSILNKALAKGIYKEYQVKRHNNSALKGKIEVARHIKTNVPFTGNISYTNREYSYDNPVIQLIHHTIQFIKHHRRYHRILTASHSTYENIRMIESVATSINGSMEKLIELNRRNVVKHVYYKEYEQLQKLCIAILESQNILFTSDSKEKFYGLVLDGAWLFEEYVNTILGDLFYHPSNTDGTGANYLFSGGAGKIYPDFISRDEGRIIADAKYKPSHNISGPDYHQILSYMYRFDSIEGYYIYPHSIMENAREPKRSMELLEGVNFGAKKGSGKRKQSVTVTKLGIRVPMEVESYEEFKNMMAESEQKLRGDINI